jgi:citrate lyase subunit beta / citryl-CoA lyase
MRRRSQLYVPANNPKMIRKAAGLEADSILFDLEDAVPPTEKAAARESLGSAIGGIEWGQRELAVRINAPETPEGKQDLVAMGKEPRIATLVVPKAESDLSSLAHKMGKALIPIIETPKGVLHIEEVVRSRGAVGVTYGAGDLAASVGGDLRTYETNAFVRTLIVVAAAAYGLDAIDKVFFDLKDLEGFRAEALDAKRLGYVGKQVVHPTQVRLANEVFSPAPEEIAWAREVVEAYEAAAREGRGAIRVRDRLVDAVHYRWAKQALERAGL